MELHEINLGDLAMDSISGFKGVVVADTRWLYNCRRLSIQPKELHDGKPVEAQTFDERQLILLHVAGVTEAEVKTGGPAPAPRLPAGPTR